MIVKKIHYFWFSNDPFPANLKNCLESWRKHLSDYEIIKWDLSNTPIEGDFAQRTLQDKKWAFLSDYARLRILHEHGGIYMDSDMLVLKSFDPLLQYESFWGTADNGMVEPVVIGANANNSVVKKCLDIYMSQEFAENPYQEIPLNILPVFEEQGFDKNPKHRYDLKGATVLRFDTFCPMPFNKADENDPLKYKTDNTYAIHLWNAAWFDPFRFFWNGRKKAGWKAVRQTIGRNPLQGWKFYKSVLYHLKCSIFGYPNS